MESLSNDNKIQTPNTANSKEDQKWTEITVDHQKIVDCVQNSYFVKVTKDKMCIKRRKKYNAKKVKGILSFVIGKNLSALSVVISGVLPPKQQLEKEIRGCGKVNGIYIKTLDKHNHWLYVGFTKPRHTEKFKEAFENQEVAGFDYENTKMVPLQKVDDIKKTIRTQSIRLVDEKNGITTPEINSEIISTDCFIKINDIPGKLFA